MQIQFFNVLHVAANGQPAQLFTVTLQVPPVSVYSKHFSEALAPVNRSNKIKQSFCINYYKVSGSYFNFEDQIKSPHSRIRF